ncbi:hypothetical protein [Asticcacaulis benevestitus]|uniref:Uncharacterized protein n=1 Tax=Asticcacaulis benevestitus DSM 16100 = ATCC BAA-896 TaxID=1121022 RepID=V4Q474_9CAUL|nr:hypothetical protein [Asticcacaulis benevestitus]ESQ92600.1 hypothetical protein ABENE_08155 [Asticcacaulis benevestitus DSM 16100 = ATCC BAA-896]
MVCDADAAEKLDAILSRAFGIADGYKELNGIVFGAVGYNMYEKLGMQNSPMGLVIPDLRTALCVVENRGETCLAATFVSLPGNASLREWVKACHPDLLVRVTQDQFEQSREDYDTDRMERRVKAVRTTLGTAPALDAKGRELARRMTDGLEDLMGYKSIHDVLHGLQMGVLTELLRVSPEATTPFERKGSLRVQVQELKLGYGRIEGQFLHGSAPVQARALRDNVVAQIKAIASQVTAADLEAPETAEAAAGLLRAMLRQQMSLFDSKLVEASEAIPFTAFAALLRSLEPAGEPAGVLSAAAQGLEDIDVRLRDRRVIHQLWQQAEATLVNIEELLRSTGRQIELNFHCRNLVDALRAISARSLDDEVLDMLTLAGLGDADTPLEPEGFKRAFPAFSREVRVRFQQADNRLLQDCGKLKLLQEPLRTLEGDA